MVSQMSCFSSSLPHIKPSYEFINNPDLLLKLKMKLRNSKDLICNLTEEENEYNYIKSINKYLNLTCRIDYANSKEKHENFIENPDTYFLNKGVWINWCDFLGYDTSKFIQTKQKWIIFCKEKSPIIYETIRLIYNMDVHLLNHNFHYLCYQLYDIIQSKKDSCNIKLYKEKHNTNVDAGVVTDDDGNEIIKHYFKYKVIPN